VGQKAEPEKLPRLFYVNWFRKDAAGRFVWPGFGENSRVLKWIVERVSAADSASGSGSAGAVSTPVGLLPAPGALDLDGLDLSQADLDLLLTVDVAAWQREAEQMPEFFRGFGGHLPARLWDLHEELTARLG
jgi:phosphoenolpyruvate carboxykinase (GTP)